MWSLSGRLYRIDQVPLVFRETGITEGYRHPQSSAKECLLSLFVATNETLNFWTHFLAAFYFLWLSAGIAEQMDFVGDCSTWPLAALLATAVLYPLGSAAAHALNSMSEGARHVCFMIDYAVISLYSYASAVAYDAYSAPESFRRLAGGGGGGHHFVIGALANAACCVVVSCHTRFMSDATAEGKARKKLLRTAAFAIPYLFDNAPLFLRLLHGAAGEHAAEAARLHAAHFVFSFLAVFLYTSHLPEKLFPGRFDIVGHSHQLFHVCTVLATAQQLSGLVADMRDRHVPGRLGDYSDASFAALHSFGLLVLLVSFNACTVFMFSRRIPKNGKPTELRERSD